MLNKEYWDERKMDWINDHDIDDELSRAAYQLLEKTYRYVRNLNLEQL